MEQITPRSDLNSSRDALDTISTGSLFQSCTFLGKKELKYVASQDFMRLAVNTGLKALILTAQ